MTSSGDLASPSRPGRLAPRNRRLAAGALALLLVGCGEREEGAPDPGRGEAPPPVEATAADVPPPELPVDSIVDTAPLGEGGWQYGRSSEVDVDGDGEAERVVVAARAEVRGGQPMWDDGQPWQVYVEETTGERTWLFARSVQLGTVDARVTLAEEGQAPTVLILEHLPDALTLYEIEYHAPGEAVVRERMERRLNPMGDLASPALP